MFTRRLSRTAVALSVSACIAAAIAPAAGARVIETEFFTINVKKASASSPSLFVGASNSRLGTPLTMQTYQPGNRFQQWTPVWPEYPGPGLITGGSSLPGAIGDFFRDCFVFPWPLPVGCKFSGSPGTPPTYPAKFVNRGSGLCIALPYSDPAWRPPANGNGVPVLQGRCVNAPATAKRSQTWSTRRIAAANRTESTLSQNHFGANRCLDVKDFRQAAGTPLQIWACHGGVNWNQQYRFLAVARSRCDVGLSNKVCGVPGSPRDL